MSIIRDYIKKSALNKKEHHLGNNVDVYLQNRLPEQISLPQVLNYINNKFKPHILDAIDVIYIGDYQQFDKNDTNAFYESRAIYVTNNQDDEKDMIDDLVHELAHAVEDQYGNIIYSDGALEKEFLLKRSRLKHMLSSQGYDIEKYNFLDPNYSEDFDNFLYRTVGYDMLNNLSNGLFVTAYSITSLREYYASGFEEYYLFDKRYLKTVSPYLYYKIEDIDTLDTE